MRHSAQARSVLLDIIAVKRPRTALLPSLPEQATLEAVALSPPLSLRKEVDEECDEEQQEQSADHAAKTEPLLSAGPPRN